MSRKAGIKRFWPQDAELSVTGTISLESSRGKFFMNSTYIMSRKLESNVLGSGRRVESNNHLLSRMGEITIVHELDVDHV